MIAIMKSGVHGLHKRAHCKSNTVGAKTRRILAMPYIDGEFDEEWYLSQYPDVRAAIQSGLLKSAFEHYRRRGILEKRLPSKPVVNEAWYLEAYPDVAQAVREGRETS